jgi:DNA-binding FadR family transcriptional regulator
VLDVSEVRAPSSESRRTASSSVNRDRVAYRLAREVATWLLDARLPEGSRLPPEQELCAALNCSRMGLRSALRLLEAWGIITIQTGRNGGPVVRHPRVSDLRDQMSILIHAERATLMDVLTARRAIDPIIAAEAAQRATPEQLEQLDAVLERMRRPTLTQRDFLAATADFQSLLADASHLVILGLFLRILAAFGETSFMQRMPLDEEWKTHVVHSFGRIRDAIGAHDSESARAEMVLQRMDSERHWRERGAALLNVPLAPFEFGGWTEEQSARRISQAQP